MFHEEQLSITVRFSCDPHTAHVNYQEAHCQPVSHVQQMSVTTNPTVIHIQHVAYPVPQILLLRMYNTCPLLQILQLSM